MKATRVALAVLNLCLAGPVLAQVFDTVDITNGLDLILGS